MPDVNEEFAKLFFELCGFFVQTNVKYQVCENRKVPGESDIDLIVVNLKPDKKYTIKNFILEVHDLKGIERAIVEVKGWHEQDLVPSVIKPASSLFYIVRTEAIQKAREVLSDDFKKLLIISSQAKTEKSKQNAIKKLKSGGIDYVLEFKTILEKLWNETEINKNYQSEILQTMRLVKKYICKGE